MRTVNENVNVCSFIHIADKSLRNTSAIFSTLQEFMCRKLGKSAKNNINNTSSNKEIFKIHTPFLSFMSVVPLLTLPFQNKIILHPYRNLQVKKKKKEELHRIQVETGTFIKVNLSSTF